MQEKTRQILDWIAERLKEPSTWHGLGWLCVAAGVTIKPEMMQALTTMGMAVSSLILIATKDSK